jgi:hypothetical protein
VQVVTSLAETAADGANVGVYAVRSTVNRSTTSASASSTPTSTTTAIRTVDVVGLEPMGRRSSMASSETDASPYTRRVRRRDVVFWIMLGLGAAAWLTTMVFYAFTRWDLAVPALVVLVAYFVLLFVLYNSLDIQPLRRRRKR